MNRGVDQMAVDDALFVCVCVFVCTSACCFSVLLTTTNREMRKNNKMVIYFKGTDRLNE